MEPVKPLPQEAILCMFSAHIDAVFGHHDLLSMLMTVVKKLLIRVNNSDNTFKHLIQVIEHAVLIILDKEEGGKLYHRLLNFIKACFHTCLNTLENNEEGDLSAQVAILKITTLARSMKD